MKLYNTLTKTEVTLDLSSPLNLYSCGPTVYGRAHIGNLRTYLFTDTLYRALRLHGAKVHWVMNITDVDDKTIRDTIAQFGERANVDDLARHTKAFTDLFLNDLEKIGIDTSAIEFVNVSDVIPQITDFIKKLLTLGLAYKADDGSTYFSIEKYQSQFHDYGELLSQGFLEGKKVGARVKVDEYEKDNLSDFALWKAKDEHDANIFWEDDTLGAGRPGWHIECSAVNSLAFGGQPTDIHTGGVDLIFPHHTNEIAQSQPLYRPFVKHWAHAEHLLVNGKKMSKSLGNLYSLSDLENKLGEHAPLAFRYLCLQTHFQSQLNFTWESLEAAGKGLVALAEKIAPQSDGDTRIQTLLGQNLATAAALAVAHDQGICLETLTQAFGLEVSPPEAQLVSPADLPEQVQTLLEDRELARTQGDFQRSDDIRQQILGLGYEIRDTKEGQKIKKQP